MFKGIDSKHYNLYIIGAILVAVLTISSCVVLATLSTPSIADEPINSTMSAPEVTSDTELTSEEVSSAPTFSVSITGADGKWNRTQVKKAQLATVDISNQTSEGFSFAFNASGDGGSAKLSGIAVFVSENSAEYTYSSATITFTFQENVVVISHTGKDSDLGCPDNVTFDGTYTKDAPTYTDELADESYSADIRKSTMCVSALKGCMTGADYEKMNYIFENGQEYVYQNSEFAYDKNGVEINVDAEFKAVKYYADISGSGEHVILICTNGGKVYVAMVADGEMRYYTNDSTYFSTAPKAFVTAAENYNVKIKYMSK